MHRLRLAVLITLFASSWAVSDLLVPEHDPFADLSVNDEICQPPARSLINIYGGITNNIAANDAQERTQMFQVDWQNLLSPAPTSIAILGNLLLVTAEFDPSLADKPPVHGWKYVNRPNSLRASMLQVANEAYNALVGANTNMARIKLQTSNVPVYFKEVAQLLARGKPREKELFLPLKLSQIEQVTKTCTELANGTARMFQDVSHLVEELLEACVATEQLRGTELEEVKIDLQVTKTNIKTAEDDVERFKDHAEKAEDRLEDAFDDLQGAIDSAPGTWDYIGAGLADAAIGLCKGLGSKLSSSGSNAPQQGQAGVGGIPAVTPQQQLAAQALGGQGGGLRGKRHTRNERDILVQLNQAFDSVQGVLGSNTQVRASRHVKTRGEGGGVHERSLRGIWNKVKSAGQSAGQVGAQLFGFKSVFDKVMEVQFSPLNIVAKLEKGQLQGVRTEAMTLKSGLETVKTTIQSYQTSIPQLISTEANRLLDEGISTSDQLIAKSQASLGAAANDTLNSLKQRCKGWATDVGTLKQRLVNSFGEKVLPELSPAAGKDVQQNGEGGGVVSSMVSTYRQKVAGQQALLEEAQQSYEFEQKRLDDANRKVGQLLSSLTRLNFTEANLKQAIKILQNAVAELGRLQTQWRRLELYFTQIAVLIKDKWRERMQSFSKEVRLVVDNNAFDFGTDIIYKSAFRATTLNYRVYRLASTYVRVSEAHFLPQLGKLSELLSIDPKTDKSRYLRAKANLQRDCENAKAEIEKLILEDRQLLVDGVQGYRDKLHQDFKSLCPPDEEQEKVIQEITYEAVKKGNEQENFDLWGGGF